MGSIQLGPTLISWTRVVFFATLLSLPQMLNEDNPRELPHRGGGKRGQRICVGVATSGDVCQAE